MAIYKYANLLHKSEHRAFDEIHAAGSTAPYSCMYRRVGCGHEISSTATHTLPPQNHHQHSYQQGAVVSG